MGKWKNVINILIQQQGRSDLPAAIKPQNMWQVLPRRLLFLLRMSNATDTRQVTNWNRFQQQGQFGGQVCNSSYLRYTADSSPWKTGCLLKLCLWQLWYQKIVPRGYLGPIIQKVTLNVIMAHQGIFIFSQLDTKHLRVKKHLLLINYPLEIAIF